MGDVDFTPDESTVDFTPDAPRPAATFGNTLGGFADTVETGIANIPSHVANAGVDWYRRATGGDYNAPGPVPYFENRQIGKDFQANAAEAASNLNEQTLPYAKLQSVARAGTLGLSAADADLPEDQLRAKFHTRMMDAVRVGPQEGTVAGDLLHNTEAVAGDVAQIVAPFGGASNLELRAARQAAADAGIAVAESRPVNLGASPTNPDDLVAEYRDGVWQVPEAPAVPGKQVATANGQPTAVGRLQQRLQEPTPGAPPAAGAAPAAAATAASTVGMNAPGAPTTKPVAGAETVPGSRFATPSEESPKTAAVSPAQQDANATHLKNTLPTLSEVRQSAVTRDYNETGTDFQTGKDQTALGARAREVMGNEQDAMRTEVRRMAGNPDASPEADTSRGQSVLNMVDSATGALQRHDKALYEAADATKGHVDASGFRQLMTPPPGHAMPSVFLATSEGQNLYRGIQAEAQTQGLLRPDGSIGGSAQQINALRQYVSANYDRKSAKAGLAVKNALDGDVSSSLGVNVHAKATANRALRGALFDNNNSVSPYLKPEGGIEANRDVQADGVMRRLAGRGTSVGQFNDLFTAAKRTADHMERMGDVEAAKDIRAKTAKAIDDTRDHFASQALKAGQKIEKGWDQKSFAEKLREQEGKMNAIYSNRPDGPQQMQRWEDLNHAGNLLKMDRTYPGAVGQEMKISKTRDFLGGAAETLAHGAAVGAHAVPLVGTVAGFGAEATKLPSKVGNFVRGDVVGKSVEHFNETRVKNLDTHQPGGSSAPKDVPLGQKIKGQGGWIGNRQPYVEPAGITHEYDPETGEHVIRSEHGVMRGQDTADGGIRLLRNDNVGPNEGKGEGTERLKYAADFAHGRGGPLYSDVSLSTKNAKGEGRGAAGTYENLRPLGYDVRKNPGATVNPETGNLISDHPNRSVYEIHPKPADRPLGARLGGGYQRGSVSGEKVGPNIIERVKSMLKPKDETPLENAPGIDKPNGVARAAEASYREKTGYGEPIKDYRYQSPEASTKVAKAYEDMKHNPTSGPVRKAYDQFKKEILDQYDHMTKTAGVSHEMNSDYPYKTPRDVMDDVRDNNHITTYPTKGNESEFGHGHPLLQDFPRKSADGQAMNYNDAFRAIHDYYGHVANGNGFRDNGEYNAWRAHRQMFSSVARPAMDTETLGQNSAVNYGEHGEHNRTAKQGETIYPKQKAGILPKGVVDKAEKGLSATESTQSPEYKAAARIGNIKVPF